MNDETSKPGRYIDPRIELENEMREFTDNPPTSEDLILKIARSIAARANHQFTPPNENGATDRTSGEMYSMARNMYLNWRDNAAAHLLSMNDADSPENAAKREALTRTDAQTTMILFDQFAGGIEFYFISETPELRGAINGEIYFEGGKANIALNILLKSFPEPNRLNVYHVAGNVIIQQSKRKRRLARDPKFDFAPPSGALDGFKIEFPPPGMRAPWEPIEGEAAQTFSDQQSKFPEFNAIAEKRKEFVNFRREVHLGQRMNEPRSIRELAILLNLSEDAVYQIAEDADFNINVADGVQGAGFSERERSDHTVEDLSFDPDAKNDLQSPPE